MGRTVLFITVLMIAHFSFAQSQDVWIRFYDSTTELSGYKDVEGNIKLPAKFSSLSRVDSFYHIMPVTEKINDTYEHYYLLKNGRKVGQDSVFMLDFSFDCESEGKIIFIDWKKDRVGYLDKNGIPIIPAIYNYVSPFRNGIAIAHKNAKRKCWEEGGDTTNCEHLGWEGGETILINEKNEIIVDSINNDLRNINWYSKIINVPSIDTNIYISLKGKNGLIYSFVDYDKEFKKWYYTIFLPTLKDKNNLQNYLFDEVTYRSKKDGWVGEEKNDFIKNFPAALTIQRFETNKLKEVSIGSDFFNELIFDKEIYKKYSNACGEHNRDKYPLYNVMITYYKNRKIPPGVDPAEVGGDYTIDYQEHFNFLRTEKGYQLLSVSLKK